MMRPSWSPTVTGISHQPSPHARMPRSRHMRVYSSNLSSAAAGMAASEWLIRYVQSRRIGKRSRYASRSSTRGAYLLMPPSSRISSSKTASTTGRGARCSIAVTPRSAAPTETTSAAWKPSSTACGEPPRPVFALMTAVDDGERERAAELEGRVQQAAGEPLLLGRDAARRGDVERPEREREAEARRAGTSAASPSA